MKIFAETERLILREILSIDADAFFEMDSDPEVHQYLGNNPVKNIQEIKKVINFIRQQYNDYGIGRWAVIEKSSGEFVGWSGLKFIESPVNNHVNFHDVGYRLLRRHWGKGFATESAKAALNYGFTKMNLEEIFATAMNTNLKSKNALLKCGLKFVEYFDEPRGKCCWFKISNFK
jgi:ribosomal-protein-alanine N-acetyltransferase